MKVLERIMRPIYFSFRGFLQGVVFSLSMGLFMAYAVNTVVIDKFATNLSSNTTLSILAFVVTMFFLIFFITGLRGENHPTEGIKQNHRGLLKVFGARTHIEIGEGLYWWWPSPIGSVYVQNMRIDTLLLPFDVESEPLSLFDGSHIKNTNISVLHQALKGRLYEITNIEQPISEFLKELASDRIRNGAYLATMRVSKAKLKADYHNLRPLVLMASLVKWKDLILYGGEYPKDDINKASLLLPREDLRGTRVLKEEEELIIEQEHNNVEIPNEGIVEIAYEHGIAITAITISSFQLPDNIQALIDAALGENLQQTQEMDDVETFNKLVDKILTDNDGSLSRKDAAYLAMLKQKTDGVTIHKIESGNSGPMDTLAASIFNKNGGS